MRLSSLLSFPSSCFVLTFIFTVIDAHKHHELNVTCGTPDATPSVMYRMKNIAVKKRFRSQSKNAVTSRAASLIDTYFCVITDTQGNGDVADSVLQDQVTIMNKSFATSGSNLQFQMKGSSRYQLANAYSFDINTNVAQIALACRKGGMDTLNIFVIPSLGVQGAGVVLGFSYPFFLLGVNYIDGVYIHRQTLPNGGLTAYDRGLTAVHETGHWLGLIHTFQSVSPFTADPCDPTNPQDYISDTPLMSTPSFGCPVGKDSCPNSPGLDAVDNFMDYANDYDVSTGKACKTTFTPNQVARMQDIWDYYRVQNEVCATTEMQVILDIKFDNDPRDLSWNIKKTDGTLVHDSAPDNFGHPYTNSFAGQTINITICLARASYNLNLFDSAGNGIASPGFYRLSVDGQLVAQGGQDFKSSTTIPFSPAAPTQPPVFSTRAPRRPPTPAPTPDPTPSPTQYPTLETPAPSQPGTPAPTLTFAPVDETPAPTVSPTRDLVGTANAPTEITLSPTLAGSTTVPTFTPTVAPTITPLTACIEYPCGSNSEKVKLCRHVSNGSQRTYCLTASYVYLWLTRHQDDYCGPCL